MLNIGIDVIDELHRIYYKLSIINYLKNLIQLDIDENFINIENIKLIRTEAIEYLLIKENKCIQEFRDILIRIESYLSIDKDCAAPSDEGATQ